MAQPRKDRRRTQDGKLTVVHQVRAVARGQPGFHELHKRQVRAVGRMLGNFDIKRIKMERGGGGGGPKS